MRDMTIKNVQRDMTCLERLAELRSLNELR